MTREYTRTTGMHPLTKGIILILIFGIVAMPFVGVSFILKRECRPVMKILGLALIIVSITAWGYLIYDSIH